MAEFNTLPTQRRVKLVTSKSAHLITDVSCDVRMRPTLVDMGAQQCDVTGRRSATLGRKPKRWKSLISFNKLLPLKKSNSSAALR